MAEVFTVEMGEEKYSLVAPDGTPGEPVLYDTGTATVQWNGIVYYCHVSDPEDYPEGGEAPEVHRVESTVVVESAMEEVSDDPDDPDEEDEDEEDEEDEDEEEGPAPGDVIQFPEPGEEEEDENLPPADVEQR